MIILSFNVRGVGGAHKNIALKRVIQSLNPYIILLQKTMCSGTKDRSTLEARLKNWDFYSLDLDGMSGGLIMGWGLACKVLSSYSFPSTISIKLMIKEFGFYFSVLNVYGPYANTFSFWENFTSVGAFTNPLFVLGDDLNFTLSHREIWGESSKLDI
jgi:hypothetical protein